MLNLLPVTVNRNCGSDHMIPTYISVQYGFGYLGCIYGMWGV